MPIRLRLAAGLLPLALAACSTTLRSPAQLPPGEARALERFDDADWAAVLAAHVDGEGRVAYEALRAQREPLDRFVALLAQVGPQTRPELFPERADRLAYYVNAYNALTMFNVLARWPLSSVHDAQLDFFYLTEFPLDGRELSLAALENDVIRVEFAEPRIHVALNCASAGCPRLPAEPFTGAALEQQLTRETQRFLHEPRNVELRDGVVTLSQIFEWYGEDFAPSPLAWIRAQAPDLGLPADAEVAFRDYDWSLNGQ